MSDYIFKLPDIGEGIAEAEIVAWHVQVGDRIEEDAPLADMMTDKATVEIESPVAGKVLRLAGDPGDQVPIGSMLVVLETDKAAQPAGAPEEAGEVSITVVSAEESQGTDVEPQANAAPEPLELILPPEADGTGATTATGAQPVLTSPAVRARAKALQIDLALVKTADGRVRHGDLDAYLLYNAGQGYRPPGTQAPRSDESVKLLGLRRRIADNMAASKRHIPHFSYVEEIDVTALEEVRAQLNANRGSRPKLTLLPLLATGICRTLPAFPMLNARFDDAAGVVVRHGRVHLGIATQTNAGLIVPVVRDAQDRNVWQLAAEIARLADAARSGKARSEELSGSTLTITSLGPLGGIATTPVINRPEVAIIGPNKIVERPVFLGDQIVRAKLMNLSISCDHRVVDGWDAASFVQALKRIVEAPALLFQD